MEAPERLADLNMRVHKLVAHHSLDTSRRCRLRLSADAGPWGPADRSWCGSAHFHLSAQLI